MTRLSGLLSQRTPPWTPLWAVPALMPSLPPLAEWKGALAVPAPLQHARVGVAPGTVARWLSLKRSHPSPKALLAPHQPRSDHRVPCSARAVRLGTTSRFYLAAEPLCAEMSRGFLLTTAIAPFACFPHTKRWHGAVVAGLRALHPLARCIVFPSIHQPWVHPSICRVRIHKSLRAGGVLLCLKGK